MESVVFNHPGMIALMIERAEIYYKKKPWKKERWYRFYIYLPEDYNSIAPAKMSLIQWKRLKLSFSNVSTYACWINF